MTQDAYEAHILVVEDDERSRRLMTEFLRDDGYFVVDVETGEKALAELRRKNQRFDIMVLDIQLPGMEGTVVAREVRRDEALKSLPILAVTVLAQPGDAVRILESGCTAYLSKPVVLPEIRDMVARMLVDAREEQPTA